jgi:hypothetical protein
MPNEFSKIDLSKINQISRFKIDYRRVHNLQLIDRENLKVQTFAEFKVVAGLNLLTKSVKVARPTFPADLGYLKNYSALHYPKGKMLVIVNYDLYPSVSSSVSQYVLDLAYEGYYAEVYRYRNGTPTSLRNFIKTKMPVKGVFFIGNLPVAWFEMSDDFYGSAEFPCDLFYMDTNGTWIDSDGDGKFNAHPTNVKPEIWVGRLWTPDQNGNNATLINDYFNRNHRYRKGLGGYSNKALAYVDDDWTGFDDCAFDMMFPAANIEVIKDPATTDGDRYKIEINEHRGWAQICAHSSPNGHSFKVPGASSEYIPTSYLRDENPPNAYFYNLFACSNARFTQAEYMGGWYIFDKPGGFSSNGLAAVGSTKTGSMLLFENFYGPMGAGKVIGDAYVAWWDGLGTDHDLGERQWYYGMVLLGDPTINWWSGVVPTLTQPLNNQTFSHYPRKTVFKWNRIYLSNVTVRYYIEIDAFGARSAGKWSAETGRTWLVSGPLTSPVYEHFFVGAQRGRWRVRVKAGNIMCPWSDWRYFKYSI